jgi:hypothetical protein
LKKSGNSIATQWGPRPRFREAKVAPYVTQVRAKIEPNAAISRKQFGLQERTLIGWPRTFDAGDLDPMVA